MAFIFLTMSALFFYLFKISKEKNKRGVFLMISIAAVFLFLTSFTISVAHKTHISSLSHGIVIEPVAKVRTAPHQENAIAFELHEGAKFTYKETQGNWLRIEVGKEEGWINKETSLLY